MGSKVEKKIHPENFAELHTQAFTCGSFLFWLKGVLSFLLFCFYPDHKVVRNRSVCINHYRTILVMEFLCAVNDDANLTKLNNLDLFI